MNKEELLQELSTKISTGEINHEEILSRFGFTDAIQNEVRSEDLKTSTHFSVTKMLYILGAVIVVTGIIFFVSQIWENVGSFGRITVTLGLGFLITATGSILLKSKLYQSVGTVFHSIGGMLIPGGALVTLSELNVDMTSTWPVAITFGIVFMFYVLLNFVHKKAILVFFAIANGTIFVYLLVEAMIDGPFYRHRDLYAYITMVIGASYLLLAQSFREGWNKQLIRILYFFGITAFLGAAFSQVFNSIPWQMFYFIIVIGGIALSIYLRSRSILVMSTLFLIVHVSYITSKHFANSFGWPISLVILGFVFIGLGYISINVNKKYIAN